MPCPREPRPHNTHKHVRGEEHGIILCHTTNTMDLHKAAIFRPECCTGCQDLLPDAAVTCCRGIHVASSSQPVLVRLIEPPASASMRTRSHDCYVLPTATPYIRGSSLRKGVVRRKGSLILHGESRWRLRRASPSSIYPVSERRKFLVLGRALHLVSHETCVTCCENRLRG